ncbi:MAG: tetratricopeptide repeat protein [Ardenticatenaceae bacterium]|nr:tetratricopeptide repeat protein [Ardenticatenaceae bacterium]
MIKSQTSYEAALNRGHSYNWDQDWDAAIRAFQQAIREVPHEPAPYAGLGMAYMGLQQLGKALENYKLAARYSQGDIIYLRHVAELQQELGLLAESGQTYMAIGEVELGRKRLKDAVDNWHRATRLNPSLLRAHQRLAAVYQKQGVVRNATHEYLMIAHLLLAQGEKDKALQACGFALQLDPRNADVLTAMEMVKQGQPLFTEKQMAPRVGSSGGTGRELETAVLPAKVEAETAVPVQDAKRHALEQLATKLFSEDEDPSKLRRATLLSQALDAQTRGLTNEAISFYEQAIGTGETSPAVHFNLGLLYQDKLRFEDAIREFETAVSEPEYRLASHFSLGECYRARGRIDKAITHFISVLRIVDQETVRHDQADRLIELYENLADSLMAKGEHDQATSFANALVDFLGQRGWEDKVKEARDRLDAISDTGMMILGDVLTAGTEHVLESLYLSKEYARRGMYNTAIEETYRAIQLSPDYLPAHIRLAELLAEQGRQEMASAKFMVIADNYRARGDNNGAIVAYEKVAELAPLDLPIRARLIDMLKRHGQIDRALEHYGAMGSAYYQLAQVDEARVTYQDAMKLVPRSSDEAGWKLRLLRQLADLDMQRLDWRQALLAYRELRELDPDDERIALTLVDLYYKVGLPNNAINLLDQYLMQMVRTGRGNKVIAILEDLVQQRPFDANLAERLYRLYVQRKQRQSAIDLLDGLGEAQLEAGDAEGAIKTLERIIKLNPPDKASYQQLLRQLHEQTPNQ